MEVSINPLALLIRQDFAGCFGNRTKARPTGARRLISVFDLKTLAVGRAAKVVTFSFVTSVVFKRKSPTDNRLRLERF